MPRKIYISGAITGTSDFVERFAKAKWYLMNNGYCGKTVVSPIEICEDIPDGSTWETYMRRCIYHLSMCDEIYMMNGWESSKGATEEHRIAKMLGLKIEYEGGNNESKGQA